MPEIQALCDAIAEDLRGLRESVGSPSFGEIVVRISRARTERGMSPAQARVGRTTVYDVFRSGRRFLDPELVGEVATALGASQAESQAWVQRARLARTGLAQAPAEIAAEPSVELTDGRTRRPSLPANVRAGVLVACLLLNLFGFWLVNYADMPLYLDMIGTAIVAIVIGPWWGAGVGAATASLASGLMIFEEIYFLPVEIVGALLWGYGVRRWRMGRTIPRFFLLNLIVALACTVTAVPIIVIFFAHGFTGSGADRITSGLDAVYHQLLISVGVQNLMTSIADKMIAGFIALAAAEAIPSTFDDDRERWKITSAWLLGMSWVRGVVHV